MTMLPSRMPRPGMRTAADIDKIGIPGNEFHFLEGNTEPFVNQLSEARLVTLAVRYRADDQVGRRRSDGPLSWLSLAEFR